VGLQIPTTLGLQEIVDGHSALPLPLDLGDHAVHLFLDWLIDRRRIDEDLVLPRLAGEQDVKSDGIYDSLGAEGVDFEQPVIDVALPNRETTDPRHYCILGSLTRHQHARRQGILSERISIRELYVLVRGFDDHRLLLHHLLRGLRRLGGNRSCIGRRDPLGTSRRAAYAAKLGHQPDQHQTQTRT